VSVKEGDGLTLRWGNKEEMMTFHFRSSGGGVEGEAFCGGTAVQSEGGGSASD
jgi:hypothetical protein